MQLKTLKELENKFIHDNQLPLTAGNNPVFGEGPSDAKILAIGEAPGFHENQQGRPFIGRSGQLLRKLLTDAGLDPEKDIYITNVVKHRPPENRDPTPEEIESYRPYLDGQIGLIKPLIIVTLGRFSMNKFLPRAMISKIHGTAHWIIANNKKTMLIPMYHPAAALRGTGVMNMFREDFIKLKNALDYFNIMGELPENTNSETINPEANLRKRQLNLLER